MSHRGKSTERRLSDPTRGLVEGVGRLFGREGIGGGLQHHLVRQLTEDHESVGGRGDPRPARSTTSGGVPASNVPQPAGGGAPDEAPARSQQIPAYQTHHAAARRSAPAVVGDVEHELWPRSRCAGREPGADPVRRMDGPLNDHVVFAGEGPTI